LMNAKYYRDLSKPMGAQGPKRAQQFKDRFELWDDPVVPACHYGVHYSSAMIVCSYLIRLEPFTQQYLNLQGGHFDHADRLFHSLSYAWNSAANLNTTDVKELIPEFFYLPEFLENQNGFDMGAFLFASSYKNINEAIPGTKQTGEKLNHVILPSWAYGCARYFILKNREALESRYVTENLHLWIDLIFGYKQRGTEAEKALNVFHYLSYEGAVGKYLACE
jgi:hypothetical protein